MKRELWLIFLVVFIDLLGFGIVIPTLPFVVEHFGGTPTIIGILVASYSFFQFIGAPILGRLSDKYGRKPLLAFSLLGSAFGYYLIAFATSLPLIFISRIIDGITGGNISVAQAYIADVTVGKERTKAMGLIGAAFGLGFMIGPFLGGVLSHFGFAAPYLFAGTLAFINSILIMLILHESEKKEVQKKVRNLFSLKVMREVLHPQIVLDLAVLFAITSFAFSLMFGVFPLYTNRLFSWNADLNGYFFGFIGLMHVITQSFLIRRLIERFSERRLIQFALFSSSLSYLGYAVSKSPILFIISGGILAVSFGILFTAVQAEISHNSNPEEQGIVMGFVNGLTSLARAFGPAAGGFLFGHLFIRAPFLLSTIVLLFCGLWSLRFYQSVGLRRK